MGIHVHNSNLIHHKTSPSSSQRQGPIADTYALVPVQSIHSTTLKRRFSLSVPTACSMYGSGFGLRSTTNYYQSGITYHIGIPALKVLVWHMDLLSGLCTEH